MISGMADLLIRNVPADTLAAIKERAKRRGRSVQAEALETLKVGAQPTGLGLVAWLKTIRPPNATQADVDAATAAIREDRDTR
jgi:plasmid stability protein